MVITLLLMNVATVYAHSGRTDSAGGHRDNNNVSGLGYYHYHHGYGPHLHPNGVCQYNTGGSNSNGTGKGNSSSNSSVGSSGIGFYPYAIAGAFTIFVLYNGASMKKRTSPGKNNKAHEKTNSTLETKEIKTLERTTEDISIPICPKCGSKMVLRKGRYGKFYGCQRYPRCKGTRRYSGG